MAKKTTPGIDLETWSQALELGRRGEPTLDLAARLAALPAPDPEPPAAFKAALRRRLLNQHSLNRRASSASRWVFNLAGLSLIVAVLALAWRLLPGRGSGLPGAGSAAQTVTVMDAPTQPAQTPDSEPVPAGSSTRLVFQFNPGSPADAAPEAAQSVVEWSLYVSALDGSQLAPLMPGQEGINELVSFSPDGQMALIASRPAWTVDRPYLAMDGSLWVLHLDGSGFLKLADNFLSLANGSKATAIWLPGGEQIAFAGQDEVGRGLFIIGADGGGLRRLTPPEASPLLLLPSPDGSAVYWQAGRISVEESSFTYEGYWWTALDASQTLPVWDDLSDQEPPPGRPDRLNVEISPAGGRMAMTNADCLPPGTAGVEPPECQSLYLFTLDGTLLESASFEGDPSQFYWSPDGRALVVDVLQRTQAGYGQVFYLWLPGSSPVRLPAALEVWDTETWVIGNPPQWSPDGRQIIFSSSQWAFPRLLDLETLNVTDALTTLNPDDGQPAPQRVTWMP